MRFRTLAEWLLAQALKYKSSEVAFDLLQKFIRGDCPATLEVFALCGIIVHREIKLLENITLIPFSVLPQSEMSDYFKRIPAWYSTQINFHLFPEPTAALIMADRNGVQVRSDGSLQLPHDTTFQEIALCLTLFGPSAPTPVARWCQIEDWENIPLGGEIGRGPLFIEEVLPRESIPLPAVDIQETIERYLRLDKITQKRLLLSLQRLNLALKRQNKVDSAIELRVALEALLIAKNTDKVSEKIQRRGSLLGGTTPAEREEICRNGSGGAHHLATT